MSTIPTATGQGRSPTARVVESSIEIGRLEQDQAPPEAQTAVVERALAKLAEPI